MRLMLDCTALSLGGGIQVGLAVAEHAVQEASWQVSLHCSAEMDRQLNSDLKKSANEYHAVGGTLDRGKFRRARQMQALEAGFAPDLAFTVFGPSYWHSRAVNLQGFALGKMLYPESRQGYGSRLVRWKEEASDRIKRYFLKRDADYLVVETPVVKERLAPLLPIEKDRIFVVENSYSPAFEARCELLRDSMPRSAGPFRILVPASFYHHKNLLVIPAAAGKLRESGCEVRFVFTVEPESSGWKTIERLAREQDAAEWVETVGAVPNDRIADLYLAADAALCTSLVESSTAVFPEAFMARRPLLASDLDYARQLCGEAAFYFDPRDAADLARAVAELAASQQLQERLVANGTKRLGESYPSPAEKWALQRSMLLEVADAGRKRTARSEGRIRFSQAAG